MLGTLTVHLHLSQQPVSQRSKLRTACHQSLLINETKKKWHEAWLVLEWRWVLLPAPSELFLVNIRTLKLGDQGAGVLLHHIRFWRHRAWANGRQVWPRGSVEGLIHGHLVWLRSMTGDKFCLALAAVSSHVISPPYGYLICKRQMVQTSSSKYCCV